MKIDQWKAPANEKADNEIADARQRLTTLTPREQEVLRLLVEGLSLKEIAGRLGTKVQTVRNQRSNIINKTGAHSEIPLVRMWLLATEQAGTAQA